MSWIKLENASQLNAIKEQSNEKPVVIFKHSTSCSISGMAWNRLQRNWKDGDSEKFIPYYLDLLSYRALSNAIAEEFDVTHASPQVIVEKQYMIIVIWGLIIMNWFHWRNRNINFL